MGKVMMMAFRQALKLFSQGPSAKNMAKAAERVMRQAAKRARPR